MKLILTILLSLISLKLYAPPYTRDVQSEERYAYVLRYIKIQSLLSAMIHVESSGDKYAYMESEDAAGVLQIRPCMVDYINEYILKSLRFTLDDRFDSLKSIQMWTAYMEFRNPDYDIKRACMLWNGLGESGSGDSSYYKKVLSALI